eukprot:CCRYP_019801-RA/>CCRYP_019801-RA protein AED:0.17 eAED:0.24 QI:0/0/0/1/0/0/4/0/250
MRYSVPRTARKHPFDVSECDLNDSEDNQNWLSDDEFLCKYKMNCSTLDAVTNLIKGDRMFQRGQQGPSQLPVKHQLMIFMHFIGREGETNGNQRSVFHVGQGRCQKDQDRLGTTPRCNDKADYSGRQFCNSLTVNVINDDKRRIRAYLLGYPGTTHGNRVWHNMVECQRSNVFFLQCEYLVADTVYEPSEHMSRHGFATNTQKITVQSLLIIVTCGWLRKIKMLITNEKESLEKVLQYIDATIVLYNMLI